MKNIKERLILSPTLYKWLMSYLIIIITPIIISFIPYKYTESVLEQKINNLDRAALTSSQQLIDNIVGNISNIAIELAESHTFDYFEEQSELSRQLAWEQTKLELWNGFEPYVDYIDNVYAYFPSTDMLLSGKRIQPPDEFYLSHYKNVIPNEAMWKDKVLDGDSTDFVVLDTVKGNTLFFVVTKKDIGTNRARYNLIVEYNINKLISTYVHEENSSFFMRFDDGENILFPWTDKNDVMLKSTDFGHDEFKKIEYADKRYYLTTAKSQIGVWNYGYITLEREYRMAVLKARLIMIAATFISILVGGFMIALLMKRNVRPLHELIQTLSKKVHISDTIADEYKYINALFTNLLKERDEYTTRLSLQNESIRESVLSNLVDGKRSEKFTFEQQLIHVGIDWHEGLYMVLSFYIGDLERLFFTQHTDNEETHNMAKLIVTNIAADVISSFYNIELFSKNNMLLGIINLKNGQEADAEEQLHLICEDINSLLISNFNFSVNVGISGVHLSLDDIQDAYYEAMLCIEYLNMYDWHIIEYNNIIVKNPDDLGYSVETEYQIINNLKAGAYDKSRELINTFISDADSVSFPSVRMTRFFAYDLLGLFFKTAASQKNDELKEFLVSAYVEERITSAETSHKLFEELKKITDICIEKLETKQRENKDESIYAKIRSFVDENYDNQNLNVNEISNIFNINASQLSAQFKNVYNVGLLDYISKKRIENAKNLLITTDMSITQISEVVGYGSQRTFMRVFSNFEKISPGKYRKLYTKKEKV